MQARERAIASAQSAPPPADADVDVKNHRVQVPSDEWPWSAIGRINVVSGPSHRTLCTGTLIDPRRVVTAAHCLFDTRINRWANATSIHFVVGQANERFLGHSVVESFFILPQFKFNLENRPRYDSIDYSRIRYDWAILTLRDPLQLKPIRVQAVGNTQPVTTFNAGEVALAGYAANRPYVLSVHKGCAVAFDSSQPGIIAHMCDSAPGESGAPLLLLQNGDAALIGIHSSHVQGGHKGSEGRAVSAAEFEPTLK